MATFFTQQDRARRNTRILVLLMALAVLAIGVAIFALWTFLEQFTDARALVHATPGEVRVDRLLLSVGGTGLLVGVASIGRVLSLRGGGAQIAEMLGGRLVSGQPRDLLDKRLLNVVEEMAIASGTPVPQAFVLDQEQGINAFAAGQQLDDAAVAVTRGCLEKLTRDELQGVIAHEMSHVLNGDMRLNIRLMGVVFGIVCIGQLGRLVMRGGMSSRGGSGLGRRRGKGGGALIGLVGLAVMVIGWIGELFAKLIRAAVSRQREFLADASAVQFTRDPHGIAGALAKIGGYPRGAAMDAPAAEEASHFFFGDIHTHMLDGSFFATHPPLQDRILRIDPRWSGQFPSVADGIAEPEEGPALGFAPAPAAATSESPAQPASVPPPSPEVVQHVGELTPEALDESRRLLGELPHVLRDAKDSPFSACAIVYALLLGGASLRPQQLSAVAERSGQALQHETTRLAPIVDGMLARDRLLLVELLSPALRRLTAEQHAAFSHTVQALIDADQQVSLFEYVLGYVLRARLGEQPRVGRHRSLAGVQQELSLLLSLLAHAGASDAAHAERAFLAAAARAKGAGLSLVPSSARLLSGLAPALDALRTLPPALCAQVVDAAAHAALADRRIDHDEWTLLRATCAALRCPLPPLPRA